MAWSVSGSGTQAATISTEHVLVSGDTNNAIFVFLVDLTNMVNGDVVELRCYTKVLTGSGLNVAWKGTYAQVPMIVVVQSPFVPSDQSFKATLKQVAGTGRNFDWKVLRQ